MLEWDEQDAICLDVIYVTDGHSNGPHNVCTTVQCLRALKNKGVELTVYALILVLTIMISINSLEILQ